MREETLQRRQAMLAFDKLFTQKYGKICGVDEAGRGPLAGDVYVAAVILPENHDIIGLDDSKKLSEKRRELLFTEIQDKAIAFCIATASIAEIETYNILQASLLAMKRAVEGLQVVPDYALIDGNQLPKLNISMQCIIKGDATSASIAAASVLAKVARDNYMKEQAKLYPEYLFEEHKGYGTAQHRKLLLENGACPIHRKSFLRKILP